MLEKRSYFLKFFLVFLVFFGLFGGVWGVDSRVDMTIKVEDKEYTCRNCDEDNPRSGNWWDGRRSIDFEDMVNVINDEADGWSNWGQDDIEIEYDYGSGGDDGERYRTIKLPAGSSQESDDTRAQITAFNNIISNEESSDEVEIKDLYGEDNSLETGDVVYARFSDDSIYVGMVQNDDDLNSVKWEKSSEHETLSDVGEAGYSTDIKDESSSEGFDYGESHITNGDYRNTIPEKEKSLQNDDSISERFSPGEEFEESDLAPYRFGKTTNSNGNTIYTFADGSEIVVDSDNKIKSKSTAYKDNPNIPPSGGSADTNIQDSHVEKPDDVDSVEREQKETSQDKTFEDKLGEAKPNQDGFKEINGVFYKEEDGKIKKYELKDGFYIPQGFVNKADGGEVTNLNVDDIMSLASDYKKLPKGTIPSQSLLNEDQKFALKIAKGEQLDAKHLGSLNPEQVASLYSNLEGSGHTSRSILEFYMDKERMESGHENIGADLDKFLGADSSQFKDDVLFMITQKKDMNQANKDYLKDYFAQKVETGNIDLTQGQVMDAMYKGGFSEDQQNALAKGFNGMDCSSFWGSIGCSIMQKKNNEEMYLGGLMRDVEQAKVSHLQLSKNLEVNGVKCNKGDDYQDCLNAHRDKCGNNEKCITNAISQVNKNSKIGDKDQYNMFLLEKFAEHSDDINPCDEGTEQACKENLQIQVDNYCNSAGSDPAKCRNYKSGLQKAYNQQIVETGWGYDIFSALRDPDQGGMRAAKYFGFQTDYSGVPDWIAQDSETSICSSKIDGYLDKEVENDGGVTKYECLDNDLDQDPSNLCLNIVADIRAQRTGITPDNKTLISYSYYLKAPEDKDLKYIVAVAYKVKDVVKKEIIINVTNVSKGDTANGFSSIELPIENVDELDRDSFVVAIGGFYPDNSVYVNLDAPVVFARPEDYNLDGSRDSSNSVAKKQKMEDTGISSDDMLDLMEMG